MTTSSIAAPDLGAICRSALGRDVLSSAPIGTGINSRVFRVELDGDGAAPRRVVAKFYRQHAGDSRDRLTTEFTGLQFLWQNGVRSIPSPIAVARNRACAIYEYIDGEAATTASVRPEDIDASVDFLCLLKRLREAPGAGSLPAASEACFSLAAIVASVGQRLDQLRRPPAASDDVDRMQHWLDDRFLPLEADVRRWCSDAASRLGIAFEEPIARDARTLSPSDFGFHNAIRRPDGALAFVDFEYFGWDDPAKTIADYLLHPGMPLDGGLKQRFVRRMLTAFADVPDLAARSRIVYPLFGLKWVLILLNDFVAERFAASTRERRTAQLAKAQALLARVAGEYASNPFLS